MRDVLVWLGWVFLGFLLVAFALLVLAPIVEGAEGEIGTATFYCSDGRDESPVSPCPAGYGPDDLVAAIDRKDSRFEKGDLVVVDGPVGSVTIRIVDTCECEGDRIIDLPIGAFETIAGDWRPGDVPVTLRPASPATLPPTDTPPTFDEFLERRGLQGSGEWTHPDPMAPATALVAALLGWRILVLVILALRGR